MKNLFYISIITILISCKPSLKENLVQVSTMGTTGSIKYILEKPIDFQKQIDSLLLDVNMSLSTWIDSSTISRYNRKEVYFPLAIKNDEHFQKNRNISFRIKKETNHFFNPSIMPLVQYWKVQSKETETFGIPVDSIKVDSLVKVINDGGFQNKFDFSAIAKGYGVDVIANFLTQKGIENFMVEIGGEVNCKGKNSKDQYWKIGIEEPNEAARNVFEVVQIKDAAMATSGNYRNYKILDSGQKIVHIINPKTGYPEISNLLSASIITDNCMEADAYATACMVMGLDTCFEFILNMPKLEAYLLYSDENGQIQKKFSPGFKPYLIQ